MSKSFSTTVDTPEEEVEHVKDESTVLRQRLVGSRASSRHGDVLDFIKSDAAESRPYYVPQYSKTTDGLYANLEKGIKEYWAGQRLSTYIPMLVWLKEYSLKKDFPSDLVAGLSVGVMVIPQGMSYAKLAGLPVEYGLYAAFLPMLSYSIFGTSRQLCIGPVAIISLLLESGLSKAMEDQPELVDGTSAYKERYISLAIQTCFLVGVITTFMGILRMGFTTAFLSHAVISGFTAGSSVIIALSQVKYILGITVPRNDQIIKQLKDIFQAIDQFNWKTFVLGMIGILIHVVFKQAGKWHPRLGFLRVCGPITASVLGIVVVVTMDLQAKGFPTVKHIPQGLPPVTISEWTSITDLGQLIPVVGTITVVGFMESIAIAKKLAAKHKYEIESSQELIGLGLSNLIGSMFGSYPVTGSFSRSAVKDSCGAKTNISGFVTSAIVGAVLLFLTDVFEKMPLCMLGAIVIAGVIVLFDYEEAIYLWKVHKFDFGVWFTACACTMFLGAEIGLGISIGLSLLLVIYESAYPHTAVLGRLPGTGYYRNIKQYPDAQRYDGIVIARIDGPLYFANAQSIRETIRRYRKKAEDELQGKDPDGQGVRFVILDLSPVSHVDTTALHILEDMQENHKSRGQQLVFANPSMKVWECLVSCGLADDIGRNHFFASVHDAVQWCLKSLHLEALNLDDEKPDSTSTESNTQSFVPASEERLDL